MDIPPVNDGTDGNDLVVKVGLTPGSGANVISGLSGNDVIIGDAGQYDFTDSINIGLGWNAPDPVDGIFYAGEDSLVEDDTLPTATIVKLMASYFLFTADAGSRIIIDLDYGDDPAHGQIGDGTIYLRDWRGGTAVYPPPLLASNSDASASDGSFGSVSPHDPYLAFVAPYTGQYVIQLNGAPWMSVLKVSVSGHPVAGTIAQGDDFIDGGAGNDDLYGVGGNDRIFGGDGNDLLVGGSGNDVLDGGTGTDRMYGGTGNDTFYVGSSDDTIVETSGQGTDRVAAIASYQLAAGAQIEILEAITLTATDNLILVGNDSGQAVIGNDDHNNLLGHGGDDQIFGRAGDDVLVGGTGNDVMYGGAGNDNYYVDSPSDYVYEAAGDGNDRIATGASLELSGVSEVETLEAVNLTDTQPFVLTGSDFANTVIGNTGNNVINGRGGSDTLVGLGGADTFQFTTALGSGNIDGIEDFQPGTDRIALSHAVFSYYNPGSLDPATFHVGTAAADWDDLIIYESGTGALYYDADGVGPGAQVQFATLQSGQSLMAGDFVVI